MHRRLGPLCNFMDLHVSGVRYSYFPVIIRYQTPYNCRETGVICESTNLRCILHMQPCWEIHCEIPLGKNKRWTNPDTARYIVIKSLYCVHDDVIKWKHFPSYWPFVRGIHRSPVNWPHKGQWRGALMFSLICVWINGWVNNRKGGDMRRYRAHYDVIVMSVYWFTVELVTPYGLTFLCQHFSGNGLSPVRRQAIIWTNVVLLFTGHWGKSFSEFWIKIPTFLLRKKSFEITVCKMLLVLLRP